MAELMDISLLGMMRTRFSISKEEIQEILKLHLASKGFELTELKYTTSRVELKYTEIKKNEQERKEDITQINETDKIIQNAKSR